MEKYILIFQHFACTLNNVIRRFVIILVTFLSSLPSEANTTCKLSPEGDTVEVQSVIFESNSKVLVTLDSDSNSVAANVSVTIEVDFGGNYKKQYTEKTKVAQLQTVVLPIKIDSAYGNRPPKSVSVISITGTKCK